MTEYICFQAEDGIRDYKVTGVQTCSLPIFAVLALVRLETALLTTADLAQGSLGGALAGKQGNRRDLLPDVRHEIQIGRASGREMVAERWVAGVVLDEEHTSCVLLVVTVKNE